MKTITRRNYSFEHGLVAYERNFIENATDLYKTYVGDIAARNDHGEALGMELAIVSQTPALRHNPCLMDFRFCFWNIEDTHILLHHPLFAKVLVDLREEEILKGMSFNLEAFIDLSASLLHQPISEDITALGVIELLYRNGLASTADVGCFAYLADAKVVYAIKITETQIDKQPPILLKTEYLPASWLERGFTLQPFVDWRTDLFCDIRNYTQTELRIQSPLDHCQTPSKPAATSKTRHQRPKRGGEELAEVENPEMSSEVKTAAEALVEIVASMEQHSRWVDDAPLPSSFRFFNTEASHRFNLDRFNLDHEQNTISFMSRSNTLKRIVLDPIQKALKKPGRNRRIYIKGGQGVGKSHLLLEANRKLQQIASELDAVPFYLDKLLSAITEHFEAINCELILVFDQFRSRYPVSIPLNGTAGAMTITSATDDNKAPIEVDRFTDKAPFWTPF
ncbi:hypothetical protein HDU96_000556 [Phlyctochytrium bullatum]|nr:hypothetical protein HDU96_000556 [Phlyctochytrium bullatum]